MVIALIAHDSKKELMLQFCSAYCDILSKNKLFEINKKFVFYTCVTMADVYQKADNI